MAKSNRKSRFSCVQFQTGLDGSPTLDGWDKAPSVEAAIAEELRVGFGIFSDPEADQRTTQSFILGTSAVVLDGVAPVAAVSFVRSDGRSKYPVARVVDLTAMTAREITREAFERDGLASLSC